MNLIKLSLLIGCMTSYAATMFAAQDNNLSSESDRAATRAECDLITSSLNDLGVIADAIAIHSSYHHDSSEDECDVHTAAIAPAENVVTTPIVQQTRVVQQRGYGNIAYSASPKRVGELGYLKSSLRIVENYPKLGITFYDVTHSLSDRAAFGISIDYLAARYNAYLNHSDNSKAVTAIAGLEARGFIYGAALADRLGIGFIPIRKAGKLPSTVHRVEYVKEYGTDVFEMNVGSVPTVGGVVIIDDLIATGGTAVAAIDLIRMDGGIPLEVAAIIELDGLGGTQRIKDKGVGVYALLACVG